MDRSLTKNHAQALQGIAVLMMLFHHFFQKPENLTLIHFFNADACMKFAWLCKLCVTIFAFLSGYGMNYGLDSNNKPDIKLLYKKAFIRIIRLYSLLWIVICIFRIYEYFINHSPIVPIELLGNLLGIIYTYNGSWWYVLFYTIICLIFPLVRIFLSKAVSIKNKAFLCIIILLAVVIIHFAGLYIFYPYLMTVFMYLLVALHPPILMAFFMGIVVSEYALFDKALNRISNNKLCFPIAFVLIIAIAIVRIKIAPDAVYCTWDFAMTPFIILSYLVIMKNHVSKLLHFIGQYSTAMWFIHTLIMGYTYFPVAQITRFVPVFYLVEVIISLIVSILITHAHKFIFRHG